MCQVILNARVYVKQKINLTWSKEQVPTKKEYSQLLNKSQKH